MHIRTAVTAATVAAASSPWVPVSAHADLHNITYVARIDGVAPGSQATFVTGDRQTNMAPLGSMPGSAFEADAVLADPHQAGMQVSVKWPYSANVHCEVDVDHMPLVQVDQAAHPVPGSGDPLNGVVACGAPLPSS